MPVTPRGLRLRFAYHEKQKIYSLRGLNFAWSGLENNKKLDLVSRNNPFSPSIMSVLSRKRLKC